jgi:hypothetical protein
LNGDRTIRIAVADAGAVYPLTIDPLLAGAADSELLSDKQYAEFGFDVAGAGDVNGDGYADVIVGARSLGAAYIFLGRASGIPDGTSQTAATRLLSDTGGYVGSPVSGIGDVNGDGYADVAAGGFVFLGGKEGIVSGGPATAASRLEATNVVSSIAAAGDVNGDGYTDVIVGYIGGTALLYLGSPSGISGSSPATRLRGLSSYGLRVAGAGDVNGDGYADVIVGAMFGGEVLVFLGSAAGIPDGGPASAATRLVDNSNDVWFGWSVSSAGDVNRDGYGDIVVGDPFWGPLEARYGAAFIFAGSASGIQSGTASIAAVRLTTPRPAVPLGSSVSGVGDVDRDGYPDIVVGADQSGMAFLYLGSPSWLAGTDSPVLPAANLVTDQGGWFGGSAAGAGDVNGDGYADVIIGAHRYQTPHFNEGAAFVFLGSKPGIPTTSVPGKLLASDGWPGDRFGRSVAVDGNIAAIAAPFSGTAYVFTRGLTGAWSEQSKIASSGTTLALDRDTLLIGAHDDNLGAGAAYVFQRDSSGTWHQEAKLVPTHSAPGNFFGFSVAIDADTAVLGSNNGAAAAVFVRRPDGTWFEQTGLVAGGGEASDQFGWNIAVSGDTAAVTAPFDDEKSPDAGAAYVYTQGVDGRWIQQAKLIADDGAEAAFFGHDIAIDGDTIVVGASADDQTAQDAGAAYVFHRTADGRWNQQAKLLAGDGVQSGRLGWSVALRGDTAVIGAPIGGSGSAYVFKRNANGVWSELEKLVASDGTLSDEFGISVALSERTVLVGANLDSDKGRSSGSAYAFSLREPDHDGDGLGDSADNCPVVSNPDQVDFDGDTLGDLCDPDLDGDGTDNTRDLCARTPPGAVVDPARGCSIGERCFCPRTRKHHASRVADWRRLSCVVRESQRFVRLGLIDRAERIRSIREALSSTCGRPH